MKAKISAILATVMIFEGSIVLANTSSEVNLETTGTAVSTLNFSEIKLVDKEGFPYDKPVLYELKDVAIDKKIGINKISHCLVKGEDGIIKHVFYTIPSDKAPEINQTLDNIKFILKTDATVSSDDPALDGSEFIFFSEENGDFYSAQSYLTAIGTTKDEMKNLTSGEKLHELLSPILEESGEGLFKASEEISNSPINLSEVNRQNLLVVELPDKAKTKKLLLIDESQKVVDVMTGEVNGFFADNFGRNTLCLFLPAKTKVHKFTETFEYEKYETLEEIIKDIEEGTFVVSAPKKKSSYNLGLSPYANTRPLRPDYKQKTLI